ncbi:MAG: exodeoxyribonuclease VII small subunit [Deltaproteobacteria bacterium]|nr:exodeoxyribonuclease VII small subunit [Deltaproteobacteria bacterium]
MRGLEDIVARLERGDQSLEAALADFEAGMEMARRAGAILDRAETRVDMLLEERDGQLREVPFDEPRDA